jgi:hypothetical protein
MWSHLAITASFDEDICVYVCVYISFPLLRTSDSGKPRNFFGGRKKTEKNCNIFCKLHLPQGIYHKMYFVSDYITLTSETVKQPHREIVRNYHKLPWLLYRFCLFSSSDQKTLGSIPFECQQ